MPERPETYPPDGRRGASGPRGADALKRPAWTPVGFDDWRTFYPTTPFSPPEAGLDLTPRFIEGWTRNTASWIEQ